MLTMLTELEDERAYNDYRCPVCDRLLDPPENEPDPATWPDPEPCGVWCQAIDAAESAREFILTAALRQHLEAQRAERWWECELLDGFVLAVFGQVTPEW